MNGLLKSFGYALIGLKYVLRFERNARIHLLIAVLALVVGIALHVKNVELAFIFFAIIIVFLAEIFNTAFEKTLDLVQSDHHPQVKIIKDMAAGAVLVAAVGAAAMGAVIYIPYLLRLAL